MGLAWQIEGEGWRQKCCDERRSFGSESALTGRGEGSCSVCLRTTCQAPQGGQAAWEGKPGLSSDPWEALGGVVVTMVTGSA